MYVVQETHVVHTEQILFCQYFDRISSSFECPKNAHTSMIHIALEHYIFDVFFSFLECTHMSISIFFPFIVICTPGDDRTWSADREHNNFPFIFISVLSHKLYAIAIGDVSDTKIQSADTINVDRSIYCLEPRPVISKAVSLTWLLLDYNTTKILESINTYIVYEH